MSIMILPLIEIDPYFMIIYLFMKYESNTPMYLKDIARKPFFVCTDVQTMVILYAPPPLLKKAGHKNSEFNVKLRDQGDEY